MGLPPVLVGLPHRRTDKGAALQAELISISNKAKFRGGLDDTLNSDDILGNILTRLPPDTIFKSILVSKRWLRLICSSSFRRTYFITWEEDYYLLGFFIRPSVCIAKRKEGDRRPRSEAAFEFLSICKEIRVLILAD
ncbi:hypothetical protein ACFE04_010430 [Oxalis oulophora]